LVNVVALVVVVVVVVVQRVSLDGRVRLAVVSL